MKQLQTIKKKVASTLAAEGLLDEQHHVQHEHTQPHTHFVTVAITGQSRENQNFIWRQSK